MPGRNRIGWLAAPAAVLALAAPPTAASAADASAPERVPGEVIVKFETGSTSAARTDAREDLGSGGRSLGRPGLELVAAEPGTSASGAVERLERRADVAYAEPNFYYEPYAKPNDPRFDDLWGLENTGQTVRGRSGRADADIDAPQAWNTTIGSTSVQVAIVDSGIAYDHPDLAPNIWTNPGETGTDGGGGDRRMNGVDDDGNGYVDDWRGYDFRGEDNAPFDLLGHGSHVAGTVGGRGDNGFGVVGVNWRVGLMALKAGDAFAPDNASAIEAFEYAADNGAEVVNASFGSPFRSKALAETIESSEDTLFVTSAGNLGANNDRDPNFPCNYPAENLVCVAASTMDDELAGFSNFGREKVDLAAPGERVVSSQPELGNAFEDDFETPLAGRWTTGGQNDTWGRDSFAGEHSLSDSPGERYLNDTDSFARSPLLALNAPNGCRVQWGMFLSTRDEDDYLQLDVSDDGSSWRKVARFSTFSEVPFSDVEVDGETASSAYLRFVMRTDSSGRGDGADIDDLEVVCARSNYSGASFVDFEGTSMASPHVAGVAALLWSERPGASVRKVRKALLDGVDHLRKRGDKIATGGRLNARKALAELD